VKRKKEKKNEKDLKPLFSFVLVATYQGKEGADLIRYSSKGEEGESRPVTTPLLLVLFKSMEERKHLSD